MTQSTAIRSYVAAVCLTAVMLLFFVDWHALAVLGERDWWGLLTLGLLALFTEQQHLRVGAGKVSGGSSIGFLPLFTVLVLFGPAATVSTMFFAGPIVEYLIRRKPPIRANFNIGQYVAAAALGGIAFEAAGGVALLALPEAARAAGLLQQVGPFILFGVVFLLFNNAAVAMAIALDQELPFRDVWVSLVARSGANILSDLLVAPVAIAVAALYIQIGVIGLVLAILPLLFIRRAYMTTFMLQEANRDLLKALVKAIETRDPYTSGHSLRVSHLAKRIANALALPRPAIDRIETAALLHDIGKIDSVFTEVLMKPSALSREERAVIESHVTKGEELLRGLRSVPDEVCRIVRHHHERPDGTGYPDGLDADAIPLGARIIGVCDAVDAMLSDRPYRKALSVPTVMQQLSECRGSQFDPAVVDTLLATDLIEEYAAIMRASRSGGAFEATRMLLDIRGAAPRRRGRAAPARVPH